MNIFWIYTITSSFPNLPSMQGDAIFTGVRPIKYMYMYTEHENMHPSTWMKVNCKHYMLLFLLTSVVSIRLFIIQPGSIIFLQKWNKDKNFNSVVQSPQKEHILYSCFSLFHVLIIS